MFIKRLEETPEQMSRAFLLHSSFFLHIVPGNPNCLHSSTLFSQLGEAAGSAWDLEIASSIKTTGLSPHYFLFLRDSYPELPVAQYLQRVVSHVLVCFLVAYRRWASFIPVIPSLAKVSLPTFVQVQMLNLPTWERVLRLQWQALQDSNLKRKSLWLFPGTPIRTTKMIPMMLSKENQADERQWELNGIKEFHVQRRQEVHRG